MEDLGSVKKCKGFLKLPRAPLFFVLSHGEMGAMKKGLLLVSLLSLSLNTFALSCEVYGISDSPQSLDCKFSGKKVSLRCEGETGAYTINGEAVEVAYHEEVEEGPSPLVFKSPRRTLRVLMYSSKNISASLHEGPVTLNGKCQF